MSTILNNVVRTENICFDTFLATIDDGDSEIKTYTCISKNKIKKIFKTD